MSQHPAQGKQQGSILKAASVQSPAATAVSTAGEGSAPNANGIALIIWIQ